MYVSCLLFETLFYLLTFATDLRLPRAPSRRQSMTGSRWDRWDWQWSPWGCAQPTRCALVDQSDWPREQGERKPAIVWLEAAAMYLCIVDAVARWRHFDHEEQAIMCVHSPALIQTRHSVQIEGVLQAVKRPVCRLVGTFTQLWVTCRTLTTSF